MKRLRHQAFVEDEGELGRKRLSDSAPIYQREPRPYQSARSSSRAPLLNFSKVSSSTMNQQSNPKKPVMSTSRKRTRGDRGINTMFDAREPKLDPLRAARERRAVNFEAIDLDDLDDVDDVDDVNAIRRMTKEEEDEVINVDELEDEQLVEEMFSGPLLPFVRGSNTTSTDIPLPWVIIDYYSWTSPITRLVHTLKSKKIVEVPSLRIFVQITSVLQNLETDEIRLRGLPLKRARRVDGMLPKKRNEVCFIYVVDQDDPRSALEQSNIEVELSQISKIRKLICTNRPFPECRYNMEDVPWMKPNFMPMNEEERMKLVEEDEVLVARWKYTSIYENASYRLSQRQINFKQRKLEFVSDSECTPSPNNQYVKSASDRRFAWRGETNFGGAYRAKHSKRGSQNLSTPHAKREVLAERSIPNLVDLSLDESDEYVKGEVRRSSSDAASCGDRGSIHQKHKFVPRQYTYGDGFCGAGGMTRGAVMAKLKVLWGFDFNKNAGQTWKHNFPDAEHFEMAAHDFAVLDHCRLIVDILHLSPPCQVFSPVHTRQGQDDEMNFASLFAVQELIKKTRPRMVTLEQTFGILHNKFIHAFQALIRMFTDNGFSVSWQVVKFQDWGLAQSRQRLIIIAAGPGETLPKFPASTHSESDRSKKPYTSVRSVLEKVHPNAPNHDLAKALQQGTKYSPWDASGLATCVTCVGLDKRGHPNGNRNLTDREFAALQSFSPAHVFVGQGIRKQIGNAVPPLPASIILKAVRDHLESIDKEILRAFEIKE